MSKSYKRTPLREALAKQKTPYEKVKDFVSDHEDDGSNKIGYVMTKAEDGTILLALPLTHGAEGGVHEGKKPLLFSIAFTPGGSVNIDYK